MRYQVQLLDANLKKVWWSPFYQWPKEELIEEAKVALAVNGKATYFKIVPFEADGRYRAASQENINAKI